MRPTHIEQRSMTAASPFSHRRRSRETLRFTIPPSSSLVLWQFLLAAVVLTTFLFEGAVAAAALFDDALIEMHSRLLSEHDMHAFRQKLQDQRRRLHLRGNHDDNSYHDTTDPLSHPSIPSMEAGEGMDEGMKLNMMMYDDEMKVKMELCADDDQIHVDCLGPSEHEVIMMLLQHHDQIDRTTVQIFDETGRFVGVLANTTSADPKIAASLQAHVHQMHNLEETGNKVRQWDPLYNEMFHHLDDIYMEHKFLVDGISVMHTAQTECAIELIQKHAGAVTSFVQDGYEAVLREHQVPEVCIRGE